MANTRLSGAQLRAARGLLGISAEELAKDAGLSLRTLRRAEQDHGPVQVKQETESLIIRVLEKRGAIFLEAGTRGEGVRLRLSPLPIFGSKTSRKK